MQKFIISLGLILLGLIIGQILKTLVDKKIIKESIPMTIYMEVLQNLVLLLFNPIIAIGAFWIVKIEDPRLILMPILGLSALILGAILGFIAAKAMNLNRVQTGSLFISASFTNLGSFGGLICYVFFGEASYAFVSMYKLLEELYYYTIGYPIAKTHGYSDQTKQNLLSFILDPYILVSFSSIVIGVALNLSTINRPDAYSMINSTLIPIASLLLVISVGFRMKVTAVGNYIKESIAVSIIKFIIVPIVITSAAYFLGLGEISNGLPLKVILVLSAMPPAFNSLIPPQIYNLDKDLANSSWLFNTGALVVVLPILYLVQNHFL